MGRPRKNEIRPISPETEAAIMQRAAAIQTDSEGRGDLDQEAIAAVVIELQRIIEHFSRKAVQVIFLLGRTLCIAKGMLPHGAFIPWIEAKSNLSERSARKYMALFRAFRDDPSCLNGKSITEVYEAAGITKILKTASKTASGADLDADNDEEAFLPAPEPEDKIMHEPPRTGVTLKRHRVISDGRGAIMAYSPRTGMAPAVRLFVSLPSEAPEYHQALSSLHEDACAALESYYAKIERLQDEGILPLPQDLRMGSLMRTIRGLPEEPARNVTPAKRRPR